jgi:hypothetical protein
MLPSASDLAAFPVPFGLDSDIRRDLRTHKKDALRKLREIENIPERGATEDQRKRLSQLRMIAAQQAREAVARERGFAGTLDSAARTDAVLAGEEADIASALASIVPNERAESSSIESSDAALSEEEAQAAASDIKNPAAEREDAETLVWEVRPGDAASVVPPDNLVQLAEIPQKWLRLEVDWPELVLDPSISGSDILRLCEDHRIAMERALRDRLRAWLSDGDPETGGVAWAFPRATDKNPWHRIRPSEAVAWDVTLDRLRAVPGARALPELKLQIEVNVSVDPLDPDLRTVRLVLANRSTVVDQSRVPDKLHDRALYLAGLELTIDAGLHRKHVLERVEPSYRWNNWLTHPGLGINCGVEEPDGVSEGRVVLRTTYLPVWRQPRIVPHALSVRPAFDALCAEDGGIEIIRKLVNDYAQWIDTVFAAEPWRIPPGQPANPADESREHERFEADVRAWRREIDRIRIGIRVLEAGADALKAGASADDPVVMPLAAWRSTNGSFARLSKTMQARGERAPTEWRLFQLAFLVSHLPGVASRIPYWSAQEDLFLGSMEDDDATATLLYFPTGGGKSEAFFGVLVLQCFIDRLRGKRRGVTGIVRYPLRLLTAQQANRFARIFAMAEMERRSVGLPGEPFQIGFWVGGGNTPNSSYADGFRDVPEWDVGNLTSKAEEHLRREDRAYRNVLRWQRLTECPFCGAKTVALRRCSEAGKERLAHVCINRECDWNHTSGDIKPLPFHVMDTDIYAYAPTVLLGTVDKMAMIAHSPNTIAQVFGMFGFAPWCRDDLDSSGHPRPGHGRLGHPRRPSDVRARSTGRWHDHSAHLASQIGPVYRNASVELFDPYPALEVQDEAHLLEQSLGTFSGLFGSMLETAFSDLAPLLGPALTSRLPDGRPRRTKIIAASATVQGPERQIEMLYQRRVAMFPHPGPNLYESYFARLQSPEPTDVGRNALGIEERTPAQRLYVSMPTNGRPHTSATVAVLSSLHLTLTEAYRWAASSDRAERDRVRAKLAAALPLGPLRQFHAAAIKNASDDAVAAAVDIARIVLSYVTNKKGGDSVQAALGEFVPRDHSRAGVSLGVAGGVRTGLITGSVEMEAIQKIVEQAKPSWKPGDLVDLEVDFLSALRGIVATSAISHGVDIERLNVMVFAGLPSDVAEYVQASSRVGRTHVGVCILVPTPQRPRDVHVVGIHDVFHRFLERMVQPAAIDRWGENAILRVLASALQVKVCAVDHFHRLANCPDDVARERAWDSSGIPAIREKLTQQHFVATQNEIASFLRRAVGIDETDATRAAFAPTGRDWYVDRLRQETRRVLDDMRSDTWATSAFRTFFDGTDRPPPMTSLRDVDEPGIIVPASRTAVGNRVLRSETVGELMRFLRRGDGAWGEDDVAGRETPAP